MSNFEDIETDAAFAALMAGNSFATDGSASFGLEVVLRDYKKVGLDREPGEELRGLLAGAQDDAEAAMAEYGVKLAEDTQASALVLNALNMVAVHTEAGDAFQEQIAIDGVGWFGVQKPGSRLHLEHGLLVPGERMFGTLGGLAFGGYLEVTEQQIKHLNDDGKISGCDRIPGGLIGLEDASICDADSDGYGEIDRTFGTVFVPVKVDTFKWARAYEL